MHEHLSYISIRVLPVNYSEDMCLLDEVGHGVVVDPHSRSGTPFGHPPPHLLLQRMDTMVWIHDLLVHPVEAERRQDGQWWT
jgi:hypothetical protein